MEERQQLVFDLDLDEMVLITPERTIFLARVAKVVIDTHRWAMEEIDTPSLRELYYVSQDNAILKLESAFKFLEWLDLAFELLNAE